MIDSSYCYTRRFLSLAVVVYLYYFIFVIACGGTNRKHRICTMLEAGRRLKTEESKVDGWYG